MIKLLTTFLAVTLLLAGCGPQVVEQEPFTPKSVFFMYSGGKGDYSQFDEIVCAAWARDWLRLYTNARPDVFVWGYTNAVRLPRSDGNETGAWKTYLDRIHKPEFLMPSDGPASENGFLADYPWPREEGGFYIYAADLLSYDRPIAQARAIAETWGPQFDGIYVDDATDRFPAWRWNLWHELQVGCPTKDELDSLQKIRTEALIAELRRLMPNTPIICNSAGAVWPDAQGITIEEGHSDRHGTAWALFQFQKQKDQATWFRGNVHWGREKPALTDSSAVVHRGYNQVFP